jgi:anti-sigma regulatory factor (Ser/Thr protein kinase)
MRLTVTATLDSLPAVSEFVKEAAVAAGLDRSAAYQLRLSVIELVTNTITHGYAEANRSGTIELRAEMDDRVLTLTLDDSAIPYDPSKTPPPQDLSRPAEERQVGGLGVFLALQGVDSFQYERVGDLNRSVLVMKRPSPSPAG